LKVVGVFVRFFRASMPTNKRIKLAAQILANIKGITVNFRLKSTGYFGENQNPQVTQLRQGVDILVATQVD
jgi:superfamily II DNA/RNA helicase